MTRKIYILLFALGLTACSTTSQIPLDDAYYRPGKTVAPTQPSAPSQSSQSSASIEYLNVQDTTITVRIKR